MNKQAIKKIDWIINKMHSEASARGAAVFKAEDATKDDPFKILVFTMLSSRTKDSTTINAVNRLFEKAKTSRDISLMEPKKLEKILYGVGFYRVKAGHLIAACNLINEQGQVPDTIDGLLKLPGVGRKTANIVLARAFGKNTLGVDVHVHRISNRLGIVRTKKPEDTEKALVSLIPKEHLRDLNRNFVAFGQTLCTPRKPMCSICPLNQICYRVKIKETCSSCKYGSR